MENKKYWFTDGFGLSVADKLMKTKKNAYKFIIYDGGLGGGKWYCMPESNEVRSILKLYKSEEEFLNEN